MRKTILLTILFALSVAPVNAQCIETNKTKVLLVGDSWASFMNIDRTINNAFQKFGHSNYKYVTSGIIAENGAETDDFLTATKQNEIQRLLNENPSIEVVHLSIGGNDVLGSWNINFTTAQTDTLRAQVAARLEAIFTFIKTAKPGVKIVWSGYTYPNFGEVIEATAPNQTSHIFYPTWDGMGRPTFIQINTMLNNFSSDVAAYAATDPAITFINAAGILQYTFGQATPLGIAPGGSYAANSVPLPLGDPTYPSPKAAMRDYVLTLDCFHLSPKGYADLIEYQTQKFYQKFLMDDLYLLSANNAQTGSVSSLGNVSSSLFLGESAGEEFATALSFNTTTMPDTTLAKASIFLRREALTGTNPISSNLQVKIKNGNFGTTVNVEATDYTATGDAAGSPCLFGSNTANGAWVRLDLPVSVYPFITNAATTQFVISSPGVTGGKVQFSDATNPEYAPVLNLAYGETPNAINEIDYSNLLSVFPNPTNGTLTLKTGEETIVKVQLTDVLGKVVLTPSLNNNTIDISSLSNGMYILTATTLTGKATKRIVKQ